MVKFPHIWNKKGIVWLPRFGSIKSRPFGKHSLEVNQRGQRGTGNIKGFRELLMFSLTWNAACSDLVTGTVLVIVTISKLHMTFFFKSKPFFKVMKFFCI